MWRDRTAAPHGTAAGGRSVVRGGGAVHAPRPALWRERSGISRLRANGAFVCLFAEFVRNFPPPVGNVKGTSRPKPRDGESGPPPARRHGRVAVCAARNALLPSQRPPVLATHPDAHNNKGA